ncbi:MAG: hypothetical protein RLZZ142_1456, partial [Verrucomicrobiota bacterium]
REGWKWAALIAVGVGVALILPLGGVRAVATLVSNEDAAWESLLPTVPHSRLKPGLLHLKSGMATIRFDSGAQVTLEAPAKLELIDAKRGRMSLGAAIVEVPQRAIGFVMEAPHGFAVDHGTKFAMAVDASGRESTFEVLSGEISVHHPVGRAERLVQNQATKVTEGGLERTQSPFSRDAAPGVQPALRLGTGGRTQSVVLSNRGAALNPRFLSVKSTVEKGSGSERRAYLGFELAGVDLKPFGSAKLRLNLVPSKQGLASYLPPEIRFRVYGIANPPKLDWSVAWEWEGVPSAEAGELLGTIEIPRAQQSGNVELGGAQLMDFLRRHEGGAVLLLLTRETEAPANGSLVHAFASDSHPQAPGPVLEFFVSAQAP